MRQIVQSIWWWTRVAVIVVISLYALLSLWNNSGRSVEVWYWFGRREETSIVALAVASFLAGGVICSTTLALFTATLRYRRTREHRRERAIAEQRETLAKKASMLRTKPQPQPIVRRPPPPPPPPENVPIVVEVRQPPVAKIERQIERMADVQIETPPDAIHVETHRATPFASTPAIDPQAKPPAGPEIVDEPKA
jgi:hypothetical protein